MPLVYFGKMVYGHEVALSLDKDLVVNSIRKTKKLRQFGIKSVEEIIFLQDKGTVYTSADYKAEVLNSGG